MPVGGSVSWRMVQSQRPTLEGSKVYSLPEKEGYTGCTLLYRQRNPCRVMGLRWKKSEIFVHMTKCTFCKKCEPISSMVMWEQKKNYYSTFLCVCVCFSKLKKVCAHSGTYIFTTRLSRMAAELCRALVLSKGNHWKWGMSNKSGWLWYLFIWVSFCQQIVYLLAQDPSCNFSLGCYTINLFLISDFIW